MADKGTDEMWGVDWSPIPRPRWNTEIKAKLAEKVLHAKFKP
jgi:hypothetical protein